MNYIRVQKDKDNPYVMLNKEFLNNKELSFKAKGLMAYLLSLPDDWKIRVNHLSTVSKDGKDSVTNAMNELMKLEYIVRDKAQKEDGKFSGYNYMVIEKPSNKEQKNRCGSPATEKPSTGNPKLLINKDTNNNITNIKKEKPPKQKYGEYKRVLLTDDQYKRLIDEMGKDETEYWIKKVDAGVEIHGYKYKNFYAVIKKWRLSNEKNSKGSAGLSQGAGGPVQNKGQAAGQKDLSTSSTETSTG